METATKPATNGAQLAPATQPTLVDVTLARVNELQESGALKVPRDYSAANALRSAWLILSDMKNKDNQPILAVCSRESVAQALLNMVLQGLNPMKRQCSFIAYGNRLTMQREYQGSIALAKRYGLKSVVANAIFDGDEFSFEVDGATGRKKIVKHIQTIDSIGKTVKGAYAIITLDNGDVNVEVMNMSQIQQAWNQGATKGTSPAHKNFPDQMACKTVINRAVKTIINSSDDGNLFEEEENLDPVSETVKEVVEQKANKVEAGFSEAEMVEPQQTEETQNPGPGF